MNAVMKNIEPFVPAELETLLYWIVERERIRTQKETGAPKPWTEDGLLRDYRWCNVRRMDDRVSRWLLEHWYCRWTEPADQLLAAVLARCINWPDTLSEIASDFPALSAVGRRLHERKNRGDKMFTGAYVVPGVAGEDKIDSVLLLVTSIQNLLEVCPEQIARLQSMRQTWDWLITFQGLGSFLAGQIAADLSCLAFGLNWPDRQSWAPVGPGSARGINRLLGRQKDRAVRQEEFERLLPLVVETVQLKLPDIWRDRNLIAMDIQNCLCEFDKYRRLTLGEGKVRARYDGGGQAQLI
jgi:hypothetical protein